MPTPGQNRSHKKYRRHEATQMYDAEMRAYIARESSRGKSVQEIAAALQVTTQTVRQYQNRSLARVKALEASQEDMQRTKAPLNPETMGRSPVRIKKGPGPGPHMRGSTKSGTAMTPSLRKICNDAWNLRKRELPFDEIAEVLGISESDAREAVRRKMAELDAQELETTAHTKRRVLAQYDAMIAAIMAPATGRSIDGTPQEVAYEAIDRMVKLLGEKAKLLGLYEPEKVDLTIHLKKYAEESGFDYDDVEAVAAEVLEARSQRR